VVPGEGCWRETSVWWTGGVVVGVGGLAQDAAAEHGGSRVQGVGGGPRGIRGGNAWAMYALRARPARLAAASMIVYSSPVSVTSIRLARGTGCRGRRWPCPLTLAWPPSLVASFILSCSPPAASIS
jgi:hypothetical protein